ncbi:lamin-B1-like [Paramacrobiotus metropolitanus]|uniref:lamin-B1-like n=1 Tax=Paramacrobiotus metropolitanus TaxID=2943436 RepID=UPI002445739C|nr:lamin-B1-like [Paramacrobiotus metropolitanus]
MVLSDPAQKTVNQLCLTIIPILSTIRRKYGTVFADALSIYTVAALKRLKVLEIENDDGNLQLLRQQRALARKELALRQQEQNELCNRCEKDVEYALEQWRKESKGLAHQVQFLESQKSLQLAELDGAMQALREQHPTIGATYMQGEEAYLQKVLMVIQILEQKVHNISVRLAEAYEELHKSVADAEVISRHLEAIAQPTMSSSCVEDAGVTKAESVAVMEALPFV